MTPASKVWLVCTTPDALSDSTRASSTSPSAAMPSMVYQSMPDQWLTAALTSVGAVPGAHCAVAVTGQAGVAAVGEDRLVARGAHGQHRPHAQIEGVVAPGHRGGGVEGIDDEVHRPWTDAARHQIARADQRRGGVGEAAAALG